MRIRCASELAGTYNAEDRERAGRAEKMLDAEQGTKPPQAIIEISNEGDALLGLSDYYPTDQ